jgi:hypothetical protein
MAAFRRVDCPHAGLHALGILVPPGPKTFVILRPRALEWDLLPSPVEPQRTMVFCAFDRNEAAAVARNVARALQEGCADPGRGQVRGNPHGEGYQVCLRIDEYLWIVCARRPGEPYRPMNFRSRDEAEKVLEALRPIVWPVPGADQEYYFNTQNFARC